MLIYLYDILFTGFISKQAILTCWIQRYNISKAFNTNFRSPTKLLTGLFDVQNISCVHDLDIYISLVNRPRSSKSTVTKDSFGSNFLNKTSEIMFPKGQRSALRLRNAATNAAYLIGSVSNHMMYYNIFQVQIFDRSQKILGLF